MLPIRKRESRENNLENLPEYLIFQTEINIEREQPTPPQSVCLTVALKVSAQQMMEGKEDMMHEKNAEILQKVSLKHQ